MITATRRLQFCAGHRVHLHESKCANLHGHNYVLLFTAERDEEALDRLGRVLDFSVMKEKLGGWIDRYWDHGFICYSEDPEMQAIFGIGQPSSQRKYYVMPTNPTAENMADHLLREICPQIFKDTGVRVIRIELWETENCRAEVTL